MKTFSYTHYATLPDEYKGTGKNGQPYALYLDDDTGATVYGPVTLLDDKDHAILTERAHAYRERVNGPQVGHFVRFANGVLRRISHVWDLDDGKQVQTSDGGSFYLGVGYMSFSGSLHPCIPAHTLRPACETKPGRAWFFHHNVRKAHNGITVSVPCNVWDCRLPANT